MGRACITHGKDENAYISFGKPKWNRPLGRFKLLGG
jgi:hypothetical protein